MVFKTHGPFAIFGGSFDSREDKNNQIAASHRFMICLFFKRLWEIDLAKVCVSKPKLTFSEVKMFTQLYSNHVEKGFQKVHKP
ncbi:unnamed protein product [Sphenostylis stenocarpa]|uniref:Uncharacterized protein n=1 Tax=Sphenostylis stenocarpa TaxID=92480 RepID=A0AA86W0K9_9FABA|nr:unnamed protein product [Sphenostylis stenocarpa]